jgi:hypothetical protein
MSTIMAENCLKLPKVLSIIRIGNRWGTPEEYESFGGHSKNALVKRMNNMSVIFRVCVGGFLAFSMALMGQSTIVPQGGEFSILGGIAGDQVWPSVSLSPTAGVVAWQDSVIDKAGSGIGGTLLNGSFVAGKEFKVNKVATGNQLLPKVQLLANDNIIFVWQAMVAGVPGIYARFAKGVDNKTESVYGTNFYTADLRINTYVKGEVGEPSVAALPDGTAVVTWSSYGQDGSLLGIYARKLKVTGAGATAKEFQVNQYTSGNQRSPSIATLANGNYVIAWASEGERGANTVGIYARIYSGAGVAQTEEIPINSGTSPCSSPSVAPLTDGGFTVVWAQKDLVNTTNSWDVWGRPFSASGMPEASDFGINTYLFGDQFQPKIAAGPAGSLVVWTSLNEDGSREGVYGRFLTGGTQVSGGEFLVNTTTLSQQMHPSVAWDGVGRFLVVWTSFTKSTGFDLYGQTYVLNSTP